MLGRFRLDVWQHWREAIVSGEAVHGHSSGPTQDVVKVTNIGWHSYYFASNDEKRRGLNPDGWKYVWKLELECGHELRWMSKTYTDRIIDVSPPRFVGCPQCQQQTQQGLVQETEPYDPWQGPSTTPP